MDEERVPGGVSETHNGAEHAGAAAWLPSSTVRRPVRQPVAEAASAAGAAARKWAYGGDDEVNWGGVGPESEGETRYPYHHQGVSQEDDTPPARGVDEETPPSGTAAVGTPLWHQARHTSGYRSQSYQHYEPHGDPYQEYAPEEPHAYDPEHYRPDVYEPHGYEPEPPSPRTAEAPESYPPPPPSGWSPPPEPELPKRVPGEPELPQGVEDIPADEERAGEWTAPELARIADELRRTDVPRNPGNGFDMDEVLEAVRQVAGVRDAWLRANATGVHTLRLDLADDADPAYVSKEVARMLGERMGLTPTPRPVSDAELSEEDTESSAAPRAGQPEAETRQRPSAPASVPAPRRAPEPEPVRQPVPAAAEPAAVSQPEAQPSTPEAPADLAESAGTPEPAARREPGTSEHVPQPRAHRRARHAEEPPTTAGPGPVTPTADKMAEALPRPLPPATPAYGW